ncbi:hypothetical protein LTH96_05545 [Nesterenkonia sp. LB17]|uniref:hypothetical protein n=1 Tax=Nesterenkonia sp. LB17 TaxID=2901230 RepID=UPI001F4C6535|nr:hypothetical protein [Nesterenkonia sp. LB17]MCH8565196.1 hypothetical protein [Nesterenkonia sp. LB17]
MDDEFQIPVSLPLDSDGFLRRECPSCEREFKWFSHAEDDENAELVAQYFCPLCGVAAGSDSWWTHAQLEYGFGSASGAIDQAVQDSLADAFKGIKGMKLEPNSSFSLDFETPAALVEPDDMVIVEPPCHPNEPVKVPEASAERAFCLICGAQFAA